MSNIKLEVGRKYKDSEGNIWKTTGISPGDGRFTAIVIVEAEDGSVPLGHPSDFSITGMYFWDETHSDDWDLIEEVSDETENMEEE